MPTTRWIDGEGVALRARADGAGGLPLLMIHEMGGCLESWDRLAPLLTSERMVVRYDQRGHGVSEKVRAMTLDELVADALAVAHAFGLGRFVPVGCAVGGAVALAVASRHAESCPAVVALAPSTSIPEARRLAALAHADVLIAMGVRQNVDAALDRSYPHRLREDRALFLQMRGMRLGADPDGQAAMLRMLAQLDMSADLAGIRHPALILAGRHDGDRPPEHLVEIVASIHGATFRIVESGHFMALHAPEAVAREICGFLAELR
jgi:pimeloyl-ACP methyl ester carboxylesterase